MGRSTFKTALTLYINKYREESASAVEYVDYQILFVSCGLSDCLRERRVGMYDFCEFVCRETLFDGECYLRDQFGGFRPDDLSAEHDAVATAHETHTSVSVPCRERAAAGTHRKFTGRYGMSGLFGFFVHRDGCDFWGVKRDSGDSPVPSRGIPTDNLGGSDLAFLRADVWGIGSPETSLTANT
jgi:hypothetical protein